MSKAANKSSAIDDQDAIDVLFVAHPKFNLLDLTGPLETFATALHDKNDPGMLHVHQVVQC